MFFDWFKSRKVEEATVLNKETLDQQKQDVQRQPEANNCSSIDTHHTNSKESMGQNPLKRLRKMVKSLNDSNSVNFLLDLRHSLVDVMQDHQNLIQMKARQAELLEEADWLEEQDEKDYDGNFDWELSNKKIRTYNEIKNLSSRIQDSDQTIKTRAEELLKFANSFTRFMFGKELKNLPNPFDSLDYFKSVGTQIYLQESGYLPVLLRKAKQLIYYDDYGDIRDEKFRTEIADFVARRDLNEVNECIIQLIPEEIRDVLINLDRLTSSIGMSWKLQYVIPDEDDFDEKTTKTLRDFGEDQFKNNVLDVVLTLYFNQSSSENVIEEEPKSESVEPSSSISPYDYEEKIGQKFRILGWKALVTKGSGDQGADVIIEKSEHRGVVQCKMYSQPVGNKAVQEVHAAKSYYDATFAVVVSNQDYTPSARMLATKLGVYLINDSDLRNFSELF